MKEKGPKARVVSVTPGTVCRCCGVKSSHRSNWWLHPRLIGGERLVCWSCSQKEVPFKHNGKKFGRVNHHTKTWTLWRVNPVHFTEKVQGYGSNIDVIEELILEGIEWVKIIEQRSQHKWTMYVPLWTWLNQGTRMELNPSNGVQVFLTMELLPIGHPMPL